MNRQQIDALVKQMNVDTAKAKLMHVFNKCSAPSRGFISSH